MWPRNFTVTSSFKITITAFFHVASSYLASLDRCSILGTLIKRGEKVGANLWFSKITTISRSRCFTFIYFVVIFSSANRLRIYILRDHLTRLYEIISKLVRYSRTYSTNTSEQMKHEKLREMKRSTPTRFNTPLVTDVYTPC